jgi:hypothetical protein
LEKISFKLNIKLLGYFWVAVVALLVGNTVYWNIYKYIPLPSIILYSFGIITSGIGVFYIIKILSGHKKRCNTYIRLYNLFSEKVKNNERIPTYHLYVLRHTLCGSVVVKQLCKDFNITL